LQCHISTEELENVVGILDGLLGADRLQIHSDALISCLNFAHQFRLQLNDAHSLADRLQCRADVASAFGFQLVGGVSRRPLWP
jgi:hypothetical protein